jgi:hypothetical protein
MGGKVSSASGLNFNWGISARLRDYKDYIKRYKDYIYRLIPLLIVVSLCEVNIHIRDYTISILIFSISFILILKGIIDQVGKFLICQLASDEKFIKTFAPEGFLPPVLYAAEISEKTDSLRKEAIIQFRKTWRRNLLKKELPKMAFDIAFIVVGFTSMTAVLSTYMDLFSVRELDIIDYTYITLRNLFLIGYDSISSTNSFMKLLAMCEFFTGVAYVMPLLNGLFLHGERARFEEYIDSHI